MPFNIEEFKSQASSKRGVFRPNRFLVEIPRPEVMTATTGSNDIMRTLTFWCQSINLPGYQLMTHDVRRWTYGPNEKRPFSPNFQQLQMSVIADGNQDNWLYFHSWLNTILPHDRDETSESLTGSSDYGGNYYEVEYKKKYAVDLTIKTFLETGEQTMEVKVRETFPSQVLGINMAWNDYNSYGQFTVIMDYVDWTITKPNNKFIITNAERRRASKKNIPNIDNRFR